MDKHISIQAGELQHKITLTPKGTASKDSDGFNITPAGIATTTWAKRVNLHGSEGLEAARLRGKLTAKFTIRYISGLTNHYKLTADSVDFNILYVDDVRGLHQWMEITAEAVV